MNDQELISTDGEDNLAGRRWILVVEDNPTIQEYYTQLLTTAHHLFDLAKNGEWGWDCVRSKDYYLIVTDHDMPNLTGLGLIQRLDEGNYRIPVILISGTIAMDDSRLIGHCLYAAIPKPVSQKVLLDSIAEVRDLNLPRWFTHPSPTNERSTTDEFSAARL
jgi:CheY-like chemotaxis protein